MSGILNIPERNDAVEEAAVIMGREGPMGEAGAGPETSPTVCLVIVTYNAEAFMENCLNSIREQSYPQDKIEVTVVDNASTDRTVEVVADLFPEVKLVSLARNLGFARANNVGIRSTEADFVALINADAELDRKWLECMVEGVTSDPMIAVAGCKIYYPNGLLQHVGGIIHDNALTDHWGASEVDIGQYEQPRDVDYVMAAAILARREVLNQLGLLPEEYFIYFEETEFCVRARKAGYRVVCFPRAVATHHEAHTSGRLSAKFLFRYHRSRLRFVLRNYSCHDFWRSFLPSEGEWMRRWHPPRPVIALVAAYLVNLRYLLPYLIRCLFAREGS